jgi:hypothetical protein
MRTRTHAALLVTCSALAAGAALVVPRTALAYDDDSAAVRANKGLHFGLGPVLLVPPDNRPLGGGLDIDLRYGIGAEPFILAPGARLAGYFISGRFVGMGMPTLRLTTPLGPLAPFLIGGVGGGLITNPSENGVALMGGGGLMIHFGSVLAIGAEATYQVITGTEFKTFTIGPSIAISLL